MKKLLLSTALVSSFAVSAMAEAPAVKAGGVVNFKSAFTSQKNEYKTGIYSRDDHFVVTPRMWVKAEGKTDYGLSFGGSVQLADDTKSSAKNGKVTAFSSTMLFVESGLGRIEAGSMPGVASTMKVDAGTLGRATGGIVGDYLDTVNSTVGYVATSDNASRTAIAYLTNPSSPLDSSTRWGTSGAQYNKVTYYTPEVAGLQFGVSYSIDTAEKGGKSSLSGKYYTSGDVDYRNVVSIGGKYKYQFDQVGLELGATGQFAKPEKMATAPALYQDFNKVRAYQVGGLATYTNFTFGGSYGHNGKSGNTKETDVFMTSKARYYTLGGMYSQGPVALSVTYFESKKMKSKYEALSVGADYQLAPGMMPYAEATFFKFKPATDAYAASTGGTAGDATRNKGSQVLVGALFKF